MKNQPTRILIMAGGTGGHVFPALAVAQELSTRGNEIVWMGTRAGLEARLVPQAGYPIEWISITGLRGKGLLSWLTAPLRLLRAFTEALRIVYRQAPQVVIGLGGFASGPGGLAAFVLRKPLVIHEQNAAAGLTNRVLAWMADLVLEAFPNSFPRRQQACCVGNPVRAQILALDPPEQRLAARSGPIRLLVLGGSLGALAINEMVPAALAKLAGNHRPKVWHQAGRTLDAARSAYAKYDVIGDVQEFIDDMAAAYAWADLVVCRSGALTVAELAAAGLPAVLIPFPHATDDHQSYNGAYLSDRGAAVLIQQRDLNADRLAQTLSELCRDRARLLDMAKAARAAAWPHATNDIVSACVLAGEAR